MEAITIPASTIYMVNYTLPGGLAVDLGEYLVEQGQGDGEEGAGGGDGDTVIRVLNHLLHHDHLDDVHLLPDGLVALGLGHQVQLIRVRGGSGGIEPATTGRP